MAWVFYIGEGKVRKLMKIWGNVGETLMLEILLSLCAFNFSSFPSFLSYNFHT